MKGIILSVVIAAGCSLAASAAAVREYTRTDGKSDAPVPGTTVGRNMFSDGGIWKKADIHENLLDVARKDGVLSVSRSDGGKKTDTAWNFSTVDLPLKEKGLGYAISFEVESRIRLKKVNGGKTYSCVVIWKDAAGKEITRDPLPLKSDGAGRKRSVFFGCVPAAAETFAVQFGYDSPNFAKGDWLRIGALDFAVMPKETDLAWTRVPEPEPPRVKVVSKTPFADPRLPLVIEVSPNGNAVDWGSLRVTVDGAAVKDFGRNGRTVSCAAPAAGWTEGLHKAEVTFAVAGSEKPFKAKKWFLRGASPKTPKTTLRDDGTVLVGGKPFFPIGIYGVMKRAFNAYGFDRAMKDLKAGGFNMVHSYAAGRDDEFLDAAARHGMKVWMGVTGPDDRLVKKDRHNPSVLAWYVGDDTARHHTPSEVCDRTDGLRAVDPTRISVQADVMRSWDAFSEYRPYVNSTDGFLPEIYPVYEEKPCPQRSCVAETIRDMKKFRSDVAEVGDGTARTVWPIIQNFKGWTMWKRFPTAEELYAMSFASVIHGANGITWYTYGGMVDPERKRFNYGITATPEIWGAMTNLASRLNTLSPVLVERTVEPSPAVTVLHGPDRDGCGYSPVSCMRKDHDGVTYVFAVNSVYETVKARFDVRGVSSSSADVLWEDRHVSVADGMFTDEFKPFAVHVYRIVPDARRARVHWDSPAGPVKPVNGVGQPPMQGLPRKARMMHYLKDAGIPYSRLHDVGGAYGRMTYVDIPNIFRDFDADENDPASYDFAFTDRLMDALAENGVEPFYRLGVTIENFPEVRRYRLDPPKDYAKWARIAEHVIRHYTEGWADGRKMKVTYWEIWNEPENYADPDENCMWRGDWKSFMDFYGTVAPYLKKKFPHLKIGGYASCGFYAAVGANAVQAANSSTRTGHFVKCAHEFLARAKAEGWPLDFFSFHSYSRPDAALKQVEYARRMLDGYGFTETEMSFNEWLPSPSSANSGTAFQASMIAAELIGLQNGPCDTAMIYDARCGIGNYSPLFNPMTCKPHKAYYVYTAFNELRKLGTAVRTAKAQDCGLYIAAAKDAAGNGAVMVANYEDAAKPLDIDFGGKVVSCHLTDETRTYEPVGIPDFMPPHSFILVKSRLEGKNR